jgi:hypothetical protein
MLFAILIICGNDRILFEGLCDASTCVCLFFQKYILVGYGQPNIVPNRELSVPDSQLW